MLFRSMHGETKRVIALVEELLLLAKLDRAPEIKVEETDLSTLVRNMIPNLNLLVDERTVHYDLTEGLIARVDADKMKQVILNVFHNAVQHTDPVAGTINVSLVVENERALLSVRDNGSGISKEKVAHVFERFYRADDSRTRQQGGAGLGLAITKSIVDSHGGTIEVESEVGVGSTFRVYLKLDR